jgi:hypothetical protein
MAVRRRPAASPERETFRTTTRRKPRALDATGSAV